MVHPITEPIIALAGLVALALFILAVRAWRFHRTKPLAFVALAFGLFTVKAVVSFLDIELDFLGHPRNELVASLFDLAILVTLALPFLGRKG